MSRQQSLSERVAKLRKLNTATTSGVIERAVPIPGDWGADCQAFLASYAQSRLWFLHQLQPDLTAYHLPAFWQLKGELNLNALSQALSALISRHPTLPARAPAGWPMGPPPGWAGWRRGPPPSWTRSSQA